MARRLRLNHAGGWYFVTARGNDRKAIFRDDPDRTHFVEFLSDWPERFRLRVHAYVLMDSTRQRVCLAAADPYRDTPY